MIFGRSVGLNAKKNDVLALGNFYETSSFSNDNENVDENGDLWVRSQGKAL
ncbi:hypothetical protein V1478_015477, partial [Vespula squamosa]